MPVLRDDFRELPGTPLFRIRPIVVVEVEYRQQLKDDLGRGALKGIKGGGEAGGDPPVRAKRAPFLTVA